jgi:hypothetical protein
MRVTTSLAFAALAAAAASATPTPAHAIDGTPVRVNQTATLRAGACAFTAVLHGGYTVLTASASGADVRDAIIDVETRLECRGAEPRTAMHQIYFAATTEASLLERLAAIARAEHADARGETCGFSPAFRREGGALVVIDVATTCTELQRSR